MSSERVAVSEATGSGSFAMLQGPDNIVVSSCYVSVGKQSETRYMESNGTTGGVSIKVT
jgi:hypothetical protein